MACGIDVVVCSRGIQCGRGVGGVWCFCYWQMRWWRVVILVLFGAAEAEVACGGFVACLRQSISDALALGALWASPLEEG